MADNENMPYARNQRNFRVKVSGPVSLVLHPSGEMDVIFRDSVSATDVQIDGIRFTPLAACQLLDAIHAAVKSGNIVFGEDLQEPIH